LPDAGVSVDEVSFNRVILMAKDGSKQAVVVRRQGSDNE
jgi:hypothetical protein